MGNELVVAKRSDIVALSTENPKMKALLANIQMGGGLTESDIPRIKNPSGGSLMFEYQRAGQEPVYLKELVGIILFAADRRTFWGSKSIGSGDRPVCSSTDMINGEVRTNEDGSLDVPEAVLKIAMPGGETGKCATCHFNKWDTAVDAAGKPKKGKACSESKVLYFLQSGEVLPCKLSIPSGSLGSFRTAIKQLDTAWPYAVVKLSLVKEKSKSGVEFAQYRAVQVAQIDDDTHAALQEYGKMLYKVFEATKADNDAPARRGDNLDSKRPEEDEAF